METEEENQWEGGMRRTQLSYWPWGWMSQVCRLSLKAGRHKGMDSISDFQHFLHFHTSHKLNLSLFHPAFSIIYDCYYCLHWLKNFRKIVETIFMLNAPLLCCSSRSSYLQYPLTCLPNQLADYTFFSCKFWLMIFLDETNLITQIRIFWRYMQIHWDEISVL